MQRENVELSWETRAPLIIPGSAVAPVFIAFRKAVKIAFLLKLWDAAENLVYMLLWWVLGGME